MIDKEISCADCRYMPKPTENRGAVCEDCTSRPGRTNWEPKVLQAPYRRDPSASSLRETAMRLYPPVQETPPTHDPVNHPSHYTSHPSGIECIEVTEHYNFCVGNAIKYLWRAGLKGSGAQGVEDLKKAVWYINREIDRLGPDGEGLLQDPVQGQTR